MHSIYNNFALNKEGSFFRSILISQFFVTLLTLKKTNHHIIQATSYMKLFKMTALALCLNTPIVYAGLDLWACCPAFCGLGPICIQEGFHRLEKANNVAKARQMAEANHASLEEGDAIANERLPHGANFPPTYESIRRRQGYAFIAAGTAMSMSALYTTSTVVYAIYNSDKQE
jgi:hypothetical protein